MVQCVCAINISRGERRDRTSLLSVHRCNRVEGENNTRRAGRPSPPGDVCFGESSSPGVSINQTPRLLHPPRATSIKIAGIPRGRRDVSRWKRRRRKTMLVVTFFPDSANWVTRFRFNTFFFYLVDFFFLNRQIKINFGKKTKVQREYTKSNRFRNIIIYSPDESRLNVGPTDFDAWVELRAIFKVKLRLPFSF